MAFRGRHTHDLDFAVFVFWYVSGRVNSKPIVTRPGQPFPIHDSIHLIIHRKFLLSMNISLLPEGVVICLLVFAYTQSLIFSSVRHPIFGINIRSFLPKRSSPLAATCRSDFLLVPRHGMKPILSAHAQERPDEELVFEPYF